MKLGVQGYTNYEVCCANHEHQRSQRLQLQVEQDGAAEGFDRQAEGVSVCCMYLKKLRVFKFTKKKIISKNKSIFMFFS